MKTSWEFLPSSTLGGDSFGYHWLDKDHFAIYLLDVCGHGVGSALLSVSAMNVLRSQTLRDANFLEPAEVLNALNRSFPHGRKWRHVFHDVVRRARSEFRRLRYSTAGHPPAVIIGPDGELETLGAPGLPTGCFEQADYQVQETNFGPGSHLYVFSDGIYEASTAGRYHGDLRSVRADVALGAVGG